MIINYLMKEYTKEESLSQVTFATIEKVSIIKITYLNGKYEYLQQHGDEVKKFKL